MVSKKLPYDTNGLLYDVYMGDSRPQCMTRKELYTYLVSLLFEFRSLCIQLESIETRIFEIKSIIGNTSQSHTLRLFMVRTRRWKIVIVRVTLA